MDDKLDLSILVNSCDSFEDCWDPFFKLFEKYWPDCNLPIILNTEYKVFDNKKVVSSKSACGFKKKLTWSEALLNALNLVDTEFILYLQEDYFIEEYVDVDSIRKAVNFLKLNNNISSLRLTLPEKFDKKDYHSNESNFINIPGKSRYLVSTQASIWRRVDLISFILKSENGWLFEIFGSMRARGLGKSNSFYSISNNYLLSNGDIIKYQLTGIIKGKWLESMGELFHKEGIDINLSLRGIYIKKNFILTKFETISYLLFNRVFWYSIINYLKIVFK